MTRASEARVRTGSLRRRVVVTVLGLLLIVLVSLGLVVNLVLGDRLRSDLRQRLTERAGLAQLLATENLDTQQLADRLTGQGITALYKAGDQVVIGRDQPPPAGPGGPRAPRPNLSTSTVTISQTGESLLATLPVQQGTLSLSANLTDIDRTLSALKRIELAAGAATLLVAGVALTLLVGVALAPLSRMTSLARRTRDGARGRRLRPTLPRTDLGRTAVAFDEMLDALELAESEAVHAEERMRQFLADASHDLRTPIAGVITTAERVLRDNPAREVREQRLVLLIREAQRAGRLVDDLLLMARLEGSSAGGSPAVLAPVDVAQIVNAAVDRLAVLCPDRTIVAEGHLPLVPANRDSLDRIMANLLDNARHATASGGRIAVSLADGPAGATVTVSDDGPGVPAADRERIFDRFIRLDAGRGRRGSDSGRSGSVGTGLGLPIARGLARAMGGELVLLEPSVARGAQFQLTLPPPADRIVRPETAQNRPESAVSGRTMPTRTGRSDVS